ncbi:GntR family transcriptional regulator [Mangrovihabitans endophyticus]|uniref:HTH-type transcriptional repressor YvoA n=1 Tax=Mangrovihabitans endophyticus TaxID=1751298 RepID=A0A8J3C1T3_9ACTN|nr:GntR family transcriptional regulator [Mangrovihabitans endophyticus]GGK97738.1 HTH-type transcriptional repressor YvoA [Mangrovihabitans endophyticus]
MTGRTPKYRTIAEDLTRRIGSGELAPGSTLPPQKQLSSAYGVTLATLRQALQQLEDDGLISQEPGRGTFVTGPRLAYRLDTLRGLAEDLRAQGRTVTTRVLDRRRSRPPAWVAAVLGTAQTHPVLRLCRLRLLSGRPAVHQVSWVPDPFASELADVDLGGPSLYAILAERGVVVHRASESVRPGLLDEDIAAMLGQPVGTPVFVSDRITYGLDGRPVLVDRATIPGSVMEIRAERAATGVSLQWSHTPGA